MRNYPLLLADENFTYAVEIGTNSYIILLFYPALNLRNPLRQRTKNI